MPLTIELPRPVDDELAQDARREGIPVEEHIALLVVLATALGEDEAATPFQDAVRSFLSFHSLDAEQVASVLQELRRLCLSAHDEGKRHTAFQDHLANAPDSRVFDLLTQWRNGVVHGIGISADALLRGAPADSVLQPAGRAHREAEHVPRPREAAVEEAEANAASIALLQSWLEDEATDDPEEIREAQQELDEFKQAINAERDRAGARRIYP